MSTTRSNKEDRSERTRYCNLQSDSSTLWAKASDSKTSSSTHSDPGQTREPAGVRPMCNRFCKLQSDTSGSWANTCNNKEMRLPRIRFCSLQSDSSRSRANTRVNKEKSLYTKFFNYSPVHRDNTCLNRERGQSTPESVNYPVLAAPLGCEVPQSFTLVVSLTVLTPSEVFSPAVPQQYVVYHDPGHHVTQQVELANVR